MPRRQLTPSQRKDLARLETTIDRCKAVFLMAVMCLAEIKADELWAETHDSFREYCRDRWPEFADVSDRQLRRMSAAGRPALVLANARVKPTHESQLRPLAGQPEDAISLVWDRSVQRANGQAPTAAIVQEELDRYQEMSPAAKTNLVDESARELAEANRRREKRRKLLRLAVRIRDTASGMADHVLEAALDSLDAAISRSPYFASL